MASKKTIVAYDSQKLSMLQMCEYKYDLTFNRDLIPPVKADFFEAGDLTHRMLETYYSMHKYIERWPNDFGIEKVRKILIKVGENHATKLALPVEEIDTTIHVVAHQYLDYYWGEKAITRAVEQVASRVLYEDDDLIILYDAKIDWIISIGNTLIMPVDHKTSSRRGNTIAISNQFMGYCWILNVNNLMVNKIGFQKTVEPKDKFSRPILSYPSSVLNNWVKNSVLWIKRGLIDAETGVYPQNFTSCDKYSGCIFHDVCTAPTETREHTIHSQFETRPEPWDVGAKL